MTNASDVVIWSADVDESTLDSVLTDDLPLRLIKLDRLGLTRMGLSKISTVQERGFKVFADAKIAEIPSKVVEIAKLHLEHKPWMLNVMAGDCSTGFMAHEDPEQVDGLKRFADECHKVGTKPCAVTVLTSKKTGKKGKLLVREFGKRTALEQVMFYAELLVAAGFTDMVCSPLEAEYLRSESVFDKLQLNCPGIRLPGSNADDQGRIDTPFGAIANGVNRPVIGRDLTGQKPKELTAAQLRENFAKIDANLNP